MKKVIGLFLLGLILISSSFSLNAQEVKGLITVEADGFGKTRQLAIENAQYKALEIIMFRGLPGTDLAVPLIENESEAKSKFKAYFDELKKSRFKNFITNTNVVSEFVKKSKGAKNITIQTEINYKALRIDLEQNQINRKFGF